MGPVHFSPDLRAPSHCPRIELENSVAAQGLPGSRPHAVAPEAARGMYGRAPEPRVGFGKRLLSATSAIFRGYKLAPDPVAQRLASFMGDAMCALNASRTVRYPEPREQLRLGGREPKAHVLVGYASPDVSVPSHTRVFTGVTESAIERPGTIAEPAVLECGSVLSLLEHRFFKQEVERRGGDARTLKRLLPTRESVVTCNPESSASPFRSFFTLEFFGFDELNAKTAGPALRRGDIVWVEGAPGYMKRFGGVAGGWHVACVGHDANGGPMLVGFSTKMTRPFSFTELRELMLEEYPVQERSGITIGGVRMVRRFDEAAFAAAFEIAMNPSDAPPPSDALAPENRLNTLASYEPRDDDSARALAAAKTFLAEARASPAKTHVLYLQGEPGRGKTHLALSLQRELTTSGKTSSYFAHRAIGDRYNVLACADETTGIPAFWHEIAERIDADVLLIDDLNSKYGIHHDILSLALKAGEASPKIIIVTSNVGRGQRRTDTDNHGELQAWFERDPTMRGYVSVQNLSGGSQRATAAWTTAARLESLADPEKVVLLTEARLTESSPAAGIVCAEPATAIAERIRAAGLTVYTAGPGYQNDRVTSDSDFRDPHTRLADVIILDTAVHSCAYGAMSQLAELAERIFNQPGKKAVLSSPLSKEALAKELDHYLTLQQNITYSKHLRDRMTTIFPELATTPRLRIQLA